VSIRSSALASQDKALVFAFLTPREIVVAARVCSAWNSASFHSHLSPLWTVLDAGAVAPRPAPRGCGSSGSSSGRTSTAADAISHPEVAAFLRRGQECVTRLDVRGCSSVTDATVDELLSMPRPRLTSLLLSDCASISLRCMLAILSSARETLPALRGVYL
jgi:hypothetical protein